MSFLGSIIDGAFNYAGIVSTNRANRNLAEYQNAFNLEMWNKQNEYNSPQATMQRLVEAGINPRAYNQLGQFANSADAPQAAAYEKKSPLSAFSDIAMTMAQLDVLKSQKEKNDAAAAKDSASATKTMQDVNNDTRNYNLRERGVDIAEDNTRIAIRNAFREAWMYGENTAGLNSFNTKFENGFNFSDILFGVKKELIDLETKGIELDNKGKELLNGIRELEKHLKGIDLKSLEQVPPNFRWVVELIMRLL